MKLLVKEIPGLMMPKQANEGEDAAYDIFATTPPNIVGVNIKRPLDDLDVWSKVTYIEYGTNLYVCPEPEEEKAHEVGLGNHLSHVDKIIQYHTLLFPRSSISKFNLILANSVATIDGGYRDQIFLRFKYYWQPEDYIIMPENGVGKVFGIINKESIYNQFDRIVQLKAQPNVPITFEKVATLPPSKRGLGGFGSSGK